MNDLDKLERTHRRRWSCGCNAGGMCGCELDKEGYHLINGERSTGVFSGRHTVLALIARVRKAEALLWDIHKFAHPDMKAVIAKELEYEND